MEWGEAGLYSGLRHPSILLFLKLRSDLAEIIAKAAIELLDVDLVSETLVLVVLGCHAGAVDRLHCAKEHVRRAIGVRHVKWLHASGCMHVAVMAVVMLLVVVQ